MEETKETTGLTLTAEDAKAINAFMEVAQHYSKCISIINGHPANAATGLTLVATFVGMAKKSCSAVKWRIEKQGVLALEYDYVGKDGVAAKGRAAFFTGPKAKENAMAEAREHYDNRKD